MQAAFREGVSLFPKVNKIFKFLFGYMISSGISCIVFCDFINIAA